jgi:hypothetical protein
VITVRTHAQVSIFLPHVLVFEGIGSQEVSHVQEKVSVTIDASHQGDHLRVAQLYSGMYSLTWLIHIL